MNLLAVEILLAGYALKRGWRIAPLLLVALPFAVRACEPTLGVLLGPWLGDYFEPAATARAFGHAGALLGLILICATRPEAPTARALPRPRPRHAGPLYPI